MKLFWQRYPAILLALAATIGSLAALYSAYYLCLLFFLFARYRAVLAIALATFAATSLRYHLPTEEVSGESHFSITSLTYSESGHQNQWRYQGTLVALDEYRNIPVTITVPAHLNRPLANQDYLIRGNLVPGKSYRFHIAKETPWIPIPHTFSLAEKRFQAKQWVANLIKNKVANSDSAAFLIGISTGSFDDPMLASEFSRFGLQHIMAISGFHFSLIAAFLGLILGFFLSQRGALLFLIGLMSSYFLFLGPGPSILRAFATMGLSFVSALFGRRTTGINALGLAVLLLIAYDPLLVTTIGFPFSALTTASILLFYPVFDKALQKTFKPRYLTQIISFPLLEQMATYSLQLIRQSLSLTLAVNILAIPLTLYYFERFPALSLIYNLFFPFLVSWSMILLLASFALPPLFIINDAYTHALLAFASNLPTHFDINVNFTKITNIPLAITLFFLLYLAAFLQPKLCEKPNFA